MTRGVYPALKDLRTFGTYVSSRALKLYKGFCKLIINFVNKFQLFIRDNYGIFYRCRCIPCFSFDLAERSILVRARNRELTIEKHCSIVTSKM